MKKIHASLFSMLLGGLAVTACYDDLGNYSYREINELHVEGIESDYVRDVDDSLNIVPLLQGSQYSDTSRFTYKWEIQSRILAETQDLKLKINLTPGEKKCRYIVMDKGTGIQYYTPFNLSVRSSTAADLIVVLSKYKGRAELSYLRLDKPSNWAVNYYADRYEENLGTNPQQLHLNYMEAAKGWPVNCEQGRLFVLCDGQASLFDKSTMMRDTVMPYLTADVYKGIPTWPPQDDEEGESYQTQFMASSIYFWRSHPYGVGFQKAEYFYEISGGKLFTVYTATNTSANPTFKSDIKSRYEKGYLCPFGFWDDMSDSEPGHLGDMGRKEGDFILFDKVYGKFTFYDGNFMREGDGGRTENPLPTYTGYELIWGSATNLTPNNRSLAILSNGAQIRLVMLENGPGVGIGGKVRTKALVKEVSGGVITPSSKFYVPNYVDHLYFTVGNAVYCYIIGDMLSGVVPGNVHKLFDLTQYGYDADAVITDLCVSRSEKTLLLGVSRYGTDTEAMADEPMGDLLYFDLDVSNKQIKYNEAKSAKGIAGIPVDVEIKYQTYWRNGCLQDGVTLKDNI